MAKEWTKSDFDIDEAIETFSFKCQDQNNFKSSWKILYLKKVSCLVYDFFYCKDLCNSFFVEDCQFETWKRKNLRGIIAWYLITILIIRREASQFKYEKNTTVAGPINRHPYFCYFWEDVCYLGHLKDY